MRRWREPNPGPAVSCIAYSRRNVCARTQNQQAGLRWLQSPQDQVCRHTALSGVRRCRRFLHLCQAPFDARPPNATSKDFPPNCGGATSSSSSSSTGCWQRFSASACLGSIYRHGDVNHGGDSSEPYHAGKPACKEPSRASIVRQPKSSHLSRRARIDDAYVTGPSIDRLRPTPLCRGSASTGYSYFQCGPLSPSTRSWRR